MTTVRQYDGDRDRLYITNYRQHKLLTLARDGTLLATYTDPALRGPSGQVLVCGGLSQTILHVDSEGKMWYPRSVCYSSTTSSIIVGLWGNNILDNNDEDVVDKNNRSTNMKLWPKDYCLTKGSAVSESSDVGA
ncbi:hypothetical protein DPMN_005927 [Dreissena polymorpha]|uniref:Uncharacterized protein n=1 Tax=Dreissena polymorpha TaxID=45954 RepID=A0A9D4RX17_DREPO|nr:hypothetical protein DPMN_005927 [Dreissena polymorpha]